MKKTCVFLSRSILEITIPISDGYEFKFIEHSEILLKIVKFTMFYGHLILEISKKLQKLREANVLQTFPIKYC